MLKDPDIWFDQQVVGYGFHGAHYKEEEWGVKGHFRLQVCGERHSARKLIWISEQKRKRQKEMATSNKNALPHTSPLEGEGTVGPV